MNRHMKAFAVAAITIGLSANAALAEDADRPHQIVNEASTTVSVLTTDENMGANVVAALRNAKGVLIVPSLIKGGFIIGGAGGSGVLLARRPDGTWSAPAFVTMGEASVGLQIGGSVSEVMFVINTDKGLQAIMNNKVTLGADVEVAVGPVGANIGAQTSMAAGKDIWAFARSQGLFAGGAFDGAYIEPRNDWNALYYGQPVQAWEITSSPTITNAQADGLRQALAQATAG